jgi:hypothetical protein
MATIEKRGRFWRVKVRRQGAPAQTRTILRFRGLRAVIYTNDHWPPPMHVIAPEAQAKIGLGEARQRPFMLLNEGLYVNVKTATQC